MGELKTAFGEKFAITLTNAEASNRVIALCPAYFDTRQSGNLKKTNAAEIVLAGYACDAVIDDGTILGSSTTITTAQSANSKMTINAFLNYLKQESRQIRKMTMQASNIDCYNATMEFVTVSPLTGSRSHYCNLGGMRDRYTTASDIVEIDTEGLELGFNTLVLLPIAAGRQITLTFWF